MFAAFSGQHNGSVGCQSTCVCSVCICTAYILKLITRRQHQHDNSNTSSLNFYRPDALQDAQPTASKHRNCIQSVNPVSGCQSPVWARGRCRISPPRFLAECCKRQLNQGSFVLLHFRLSTFSDLYWVCLSVFSCTVLFISISQVIGCEDRLRNDLYCVEWGVKLYSNQQIWLPDFSKHYDYYAKSHAQSEKMQPSVTDVLCVCLPAKQNYEPYTHTHA